MGALDTTGGGGFTGVGEPGSPFGQLQCVGGFPCGRGSDPRYIVEEAEYAVLPRAGTVDPHWTWMYGAPARPCLEATFSLNAATPTSRPPSPPPATHVAFTPPPRP